jgi:hypothetical protein
MSLLPIKAKADAGHEKTKKQHHAQRHGKYVQTITRHMCNLPVFLWLLLTRHSKIRAVRLSKLFRSLLVPLEP